MMTATTANFVNEIKEVLPKQLPTWVMILAVLTFMVLQGYIGLPEKVRQNTETIEEVQRMQAETSANVSQALCILKMQVETQDENPSPLEVERRCTE